MKTGGKSLIVMLVSVMVLFSGCGKTNTGTTPSSQDSGNVSQSEKGGGILRYGLSAEPAILEPVLAQGIAKRIITQSMYRGLMTYTKDGEIITDIAESVDVGSDNKTYTIKLRDVKFHNGDTLTSEDVKFSFERILNPEYGASFRHELSIIDRMETPDDKTIIFALKEECAPFKHYLALPESAILSKSYTEAHDSNLDTEPMGAGPFKFVEWNKGQNIIVEAFRDYYVDNKPKVDRIEFSFYADDDARTNALKSGEVDLIDYVPWKDIPSLENDPEIKLDQQNGPVMILSFNTNVKPLDDPKVRQAISYAINRDNVINTAFNGRGTPCYGFVFNEGFLGYNSSQTKYFEYNIEKAKKLLADAGYPNGFSCRLLSSSSYSMHQQTAIAVQSDLKKIGIELTLDLPDWATRMSKVGEKNYDIFINAMTGDYSDPDWLSNFMQSGAHTFNKSADFADAEVDRLLMEGRKTLDETQRGKIYEQLIDRLLELSPHVFLNWREQTSAMRVNVNGFAQRPGYLCLSQSGLILEDISLSK
ncbi:ABC transporter substrate-binding protein [Petroclostridium sp. X23]|uniref:ABC transporter substrate-binding protein n=1 Tax=Petroclostridium sp. X23 TaxID=3045146 RepID=UPI0024AD1E6D|nr:ABC transporter substrate-binding protein [Petroclostridium sp. X23]WHH60103.1 ABC transporter substrate-binding protein [Petroclostridium sp. X23]